jgi:ferredoxin--NADP+ reductase
VYIQDLVASGRLEEELGAPLDPGRTHVFLCGNPAMIGLPTWDGDTPAFPDTLGVCQQLHERGFTIDHHKVRGNVHYEEFWTER